MKKVCGFKFYSIRDIFKSGGFTRPATNWSLRPYIVRFSHWKERDVPELKYVAVLENVDKRRAWIYEVNGEAFLIIYETEPFHNHKQYQIFVENDADDKLLFPIKLGVVKLFENQVLTIENEEGVGEFVKKLLKKDWLIRFPSGLKAKAG